MSIENVEPPTVASYEQREVASIWRLAIKNCNSLICLNNGPKKNPLYCVHPITGDVVGLRDLASLINGYRFYGIQVPSDRMNSEFSRTVEGMARYYVRLISDSEPEGPITLAGWSSGAIIALEMAHLLRAQGREIPLLIALDGAPCNSGGRLPIWHPLYALKLIWNLPRWIRDDRIQDWSLRGILQRLRSKLIIRFGMGSSTIANVDTLDAETIQRLFDADGWLPGQKSFIHAMYKAMLAYVPKPYEGRVIVYETRTQPLYHLRQIGVAWRQLATRVEVVSLPGNHSRLILPPTIGIIASHLSSC